MDASAWEAAPSALTRFDLTRAALYANAESLALGGAGAAYATGSLGLQLNPAAAARRRAAAEAPLHVSLTALRGRIGSGALPDAPLAGAPDWFDLGVGVAGGSWGVGVLVSAVTLRGEAETVVGAEAHGAVGVQLADGAVALGAGPRVLAVRRADASGVRDYLGVGSELGAVVALPGQPWSLAVAARSGLRAPVSAGVQGDEMVLPPGLRVGVGWANTGAPADLPVRVVADLLLDGSTADALGLQAAIDGESEARGAWMTLTPRVGVEVDVWPETFRGRLGSWLEPSRSARGPPTPHLTGGVELRLFRVEAPEVDLAWDLAWQVGMDWAPGSFRGAWLGLTVWHDGAVGRPSDIGA